MTCSAAAAGADRALKYRAGPSRAANDRSNGLQQRRPFGLPFEMLQKSQFGRQIVEIEPHVRTYANRLIRGGSDFARFDADFRGFSSGERRPPEPFRARQSMPSINIASCAEVSVTVPPGSAKRGHEIVRDRCGLVNEARPLPHPENRIFKKRSIPFHACRSDDHHAFSLRRPAASPRPDHGSLAQRCTDHHPVR